MLAAYAPRGRVLSLIGRTLVPDDVSRRFFICSLSSASTARARASNPTTALPPARGATAGASAAPAPASGGSAARYRARAPSPARPAVGSCPRRGPCIGARRRPPLRASPSSRPRVAPADARWAMLWGGRVLERSEHYYVTRETRQVPRHWGPQRARQAPGLRRRGVLAAFAMPSGEARGSCQRVRQGPTGQVNVATEPPPT